MWTLKRWYPDIPDNDFTELFDCSRRMQLVLDFLSREQPDICFLQEVQLEDVLPHMLLPTLESMGYMLVSTCEFRQQYGSEEITETEWEALGGYRRHGNAVLVRKAERSGGLAIDPSTVSSVEIELNAQGNHACLAQFDMMVATADSRIRVLTLACHLDWRGQANLQEVQQMQRDIVRELKSPNSKTDLVLVGGDFNAQPWSESIQAMVCSSWIVCFLSIPFPRLSFFSTTADDFISFPSLSMDTEKLQQVKRIQKRLYAFRRSRKKPCALTTCSTHTKPVTAKSPLCK